jgi:hypothetical protein
MKLLDKVGDALLARLVPGLDAKASCGRCKVQSYKCVGCSVNDSYLHVQRWAYDDCGDLCWVMCTPTRCG